MLLYVDVNAAAADVNAHVSPFYCCECSGCCLLLRMLLTAAVNGAAATGNAVNAAATTRCG